MDKLIESKLEHDCFDYLINCSVDFVTQYYCSKCKSLFEETISHDGLDWIGWFGEEE